LHGRPGEALAISAKIRQCSREKRSSLSARASARKKKSLRPLKPRVRGFFALFHVWFHFVLGKNKRGKMGEILWMVAVMNCFP